MTCAGSGIFEMKKNGLEDPVYFQFLVRREAALRNRVLHVSTRTDTRREKISLKPGANVKLSTYGDTSDHWAE